MNCKKLDVDANIIKSFTEKKLNTDLINYLSNCFKIIFDDHGEPIPFIIEEKILKLLNAIIAETTDSNIIKEVFISLRNSVVNSSYDTQRLVLADEITLNHAIKLLQDGGSSTKIVLQFLINCVVNNAENAIKVWNVLQYHLISLMQNNEYSYFAAALFYNILYLHKNLDYSTNLFGIVLELCSSNCVSNDYYLFLLDLFLQNKRFFVAFDEIDVVHRIAALNYILEHKKDDIEPANVGYLIMQFKKKSDCILKTVTTYVEQIEPEEVVLLLELLASLSAKEKYIPSIQADRSLMINCAFLLKSLHTIGKESNNYFTPVEKLQNADGVDKHVVYGFKALLIKLIGNMCWKNIDNQNQFRELGGIPILLECSTIDARNPFITQWCILAIRNLCESNLENQAVIAGMNRQGIIDSSTLHQMGLTLHDDGSNKIGIVPLNILRCDKT